MKMFGQRATVIKWAIVLGVPILGGLIAIITPNIMNALNRAHLRETKMSMAQIIQAINDYQKDCKKAPATLDDLVRADDCKSWGPSPYMKRFPKDGWGNEFTYEVKNGVPVVRTNYKGKDFELVSMEKYKGLTPYEACMAMKKDGLGCYDGDYNDQ